MTVTDQAGTIVNFGGEPVSCSKMPCHSLCQEQKQICSFYFDLQKAANAYENEPATTPNTNPNSNTPTPCEKAIQNPSRTNSGIKITVCNETITIPTTSLEGNCTAEAAAVNCTT